MLLVKQFSTFPLFNFCFYSCHSFTRDSTLASQCKKKMSAKYNQVVGDEKFIDVSPGRGSTDSLNSTLLDSEYDGKIRDVESVPLAGQKCNNRWMWFVHAVLLSLSFGLFMSAHFTRVTTLQHVKGYSAWCELNL